jgi:hypothetical protein
MSTTPVTPAKLPLKERAKKELISYLGIAGYLAVLFCALIAYSMLIGRHADIDSKLTFGFAIFNALVIGKVIAIGEVMRLGHRTEVHPVYQTVLLKSVIFGLFILAFHVVEELIKHLIHHEPVGATLNKVSLEQIAARSIVIFIALIPFFAFRELARVLGEDRLHKLFFHARD